MKNLVGQLTLAMDALGVLATAAKRADAPSGYMFIAFKADLFLPLDEYRREVSRRVAAIKATPRQPGVDEIRIPSEQAFRTRAMRRVDGFVLERRIHDRIAAL